MKKGITLQLRLTLITSLLLVILSAAFTVAGMYNLKENVINPLQITIEFDSNKLAAQLNKQLSEVGDNGINDFTIRSTIKPYSQFSLWFMAAAIMAGTIIMYFLSGIVLKPAKKLAGDIANVDKDTLSNRFTEFNAGDELNTIANSFNGMLERLQSAFEREQRFSAAAAHELKTPLTVIKTNLDVFELDESPSEQEVKSVLEIVRRQTDRMITLVNDLMELSATDACEKKDEVAIDKLLAEIADELSSDMERRGITYELDTMPCNIIANAVMIKNAISNLWSNAIRYNTENGRIFIFESREGDLCIISIVDTGIGIDEEKSKYIFEPFYRVDVSRSRAAGGAGLGLTIAKEIIMQHDGTIVYEKNKPHGSRFTITLPVT